MKVALTGLALILLTLPATAQTATCKSQADEKKVAGVAMKSFLTKCEKDAKTTASAKEKKLAGAAKTSFTKKCVTDATGA